MDDQLKLSAQVNNTDKKVVFVTGATGAIGKAIVRQIASKPDYLVVAVARNLAKAEKTIDDIRRTTGNKDVYYVMADLSSKKEIKGLAAAYQGPLDVLVNNAAATPRSRQETKAGIEMQWATNVLGYYWMINAFLPHLQKRTPSRIVNVASYWAGGLDLEDPEFKHRHYNNDAAYRQSKQANRMLSKAFADKLSKKGIAVNSCHPGDVNSQLSNNLGFGGHETPDEGADTPVWLAVNEVGIKNTGKYFAHRSESSCHFSADNQMVKSLYQLC